MFSSGAVDAAMPDIARTGGITEMKKIVAVAEPFGVPVSPHNYSSGVCTAATLQLMAAMPTSGPLEWEVTNSSIVDGLFIEPLLVSNGEVRVPLIPGLGVHLPVAVREKYAC
jgi:L-alanine-DL-glutamate epimerase-like enolase superfamily enzyme